MLIQFSTHQSSFAITNENGEVIASQSIENIKGEVNIAKLIEESSSLVYQLLDLVSELEKKKIIIKTQLHENSVKVVEETT